MSFGMIGAIYPNAQSKCDAQINLCEKERCKMKIKVWVGDEDVQGKVLEELGTCLCDSPARAVQMYNQEQIWIDKGYNADIHYRIIED